MGILIVIVSAFALVAMVAFGVKIYRQGYWTVRQQKTVSWVIILYGIFLATLVGTVTKLVLPGIGSIALGAGAGAMAGYLSWLVVGTVGVATGGVGIAVGWILMSLIGSFFGLLGSAVGGTMLQTAIVPLVSPVFWIPIVILGVYIRRTKRLKMQKTLPLNKQ